MDITQAQTGKIRHDQANVNAGSGGDYGDTTRKGRLMPIVKKW